MKKGIYCEGSLRARVLVMSDLVLDDRRYVELVCIETLEAHAKGEIFPGARWTAEEQKGYEGMIWTLEFDE